jgi:two-component system chemotaxis response regulator CheB
MAFPVICFGSSAGGLDPLRRVMRRLRADRGCAFVVVNHLRHYRTKLPEILGRITSIPVQLIDDGLSLKPDNIYIIPPNCELTLEHNIFRLGPISKPLGWPRVITVFLKSLAETWDGMPVAVILSGLDSDGAGALRSIKAAGGITFVQKPETAEFPEMPQSAIYTGCVDFELTPERIAHRLGQIGC